MSDRSQHLISAVHLAVRKLSATTSVEETLREVLELCVAAADTEAGSIYIHNPESRCLEFRHVLPPDHADKLPAQIPDDYGVAGQVFQSRSVAVTGGSGDGELAVRSMLTVPLCVPGGDPIGVVQLINKRNGSFSDQDSEVLESVGAVSAMATANSILVEQVGRSASLMGMGNVAHDIANLAGALRSHLFLVDPLVDRLQSSDDCKELREAVDDLSAGTARLERYSHLISDIAAGRPVRVSKSAGNLPQAVLEAAYYLEPMARREQCELVYEVDPDEVATHFDALAVQRVVENLVTNAVKAVKESGRERSVRLRFKSDGSDFVLEVIDTGPGMTEFAVSRILSGTAVSQWTASSGTGLGTKVVRELVAAMGGRMEIESKIGTGTTFRVFIPSERESAQV
jgi:signal transduction histidine kinase